jgi:hypothetical protein
LRHFASLLLAFVVAHGQELGDADICSQGNGSGRKARHWRRKRQRNWWHWALKLALKAAAGFAGVENPLFFNENTRMVFGDAKQTLQAIVNEFKAA